MPDELAVVLRVLEKIDRDRAAVDIARDLKKAGSTGHKLEASTLRILNIVEKYYTNSPTIHTVKTALHKTDYGKRCKILHPETPTENGVDD